jgi:hypothetical protein
MVCLVVLAAVLADRRVDQLLVEPVLAVKVMLVAMVSMQLPVLVEVAKASRVETQFFPLRPVMEVMALLAVFLVLLLLIVAVVAVGLVELSLPEPVAWAVAVVALAMG